jgi:iron complex transport system substrate-binding protein
MKQLLTILLILTCSLSESHAEITLTDDTGQKITLQQPAKRIVSLSPGNTELLFAAGATDQLIAAVSFSNYPEQARQLPVIGTYNQLDIERIVALQPDIVIGWNSGNPKHQIKQLKKLGLAVYLSELDEFQDIPETLIRFGRLINTEKLARQQASEFNQRLNELKQTYLNKPHKNKVFIQIWNNPVMSVNQQHLISKVIKFCGGSNIFADHHQLSMSLDLESVISRNPDVIIATGMAQTSRLWLQRWHQWPVINAVKNQRLFAVNPDHLVRHTPRILLGIAEVCEKLKSNAN